MKGRLKWNANLDVWRGHQGLERACTDAEAGDGIALRQKHSERALGVQHGQQGCHRGEGGGKDWNDCVPGAWRRRDTSAPALHSSVVPVLGSLGDLRRLSWVDSIACVETVSLHFAYRQAFCLVHPSSQTSPRRDGVQQVQLPARHMTDLGEASSGIRALLEGTVMVSSYGFRCDTVIPMDKPLEYGTVSYASLEFCGALVAGVKLQVEVLFLFVRRESSLTKLTMFQHRSSNNRHNRPLP